MAGDVFGRDRPIPQGWDIEHELDPADDADRYAEAPGAWTLDLRVVRDDGVILAERTVNVATIDPAQIAEAATVDGDHGAAALHDGHTVTLEVRDPLGDIGPAGEWVVIVVMTP